MNSDGFSSERHPIFRPPVICHAWLRDGSDGPVPELRLRLLVTK